MSNWYFDEPMDELATYNRRVVYTEDMIVTEHRSHFVKDTGMFNEMEQIEEWFIRKQVIEDWTTCLWAAPTDMPPGEYITLNRST